MKHCGTQTLETKRLILRRFTVRDADAMYTNWASDPEVTRYLTWPAHAGVETSRAVLADWTAAYAQESCYQWAIVLKDRADEPIGSIGAVMSATISRRYRSATAWEDAGGIRGSCPRPSGR